MSQYAETYEAETLGGLQALVNQRIRKGWKVQHVAPLTGYSNGETRASVFIVYEVGEDGAP